MVRVSAASLVIIAFVAACTSQRIGRTPTPDGGYKLVCEKPLADCLTDLTKDICRDYGYDVSRGKEVVERHGVEPVNSIIVRSEAIIRCRSSGALLVDDSPPLPPGADVAGAAKAPKCFPGATQGCLGPGACQGAQTCRADGMSFGSCDCGTAAPASGGAPPPAAESTGVPATPPPPAPSPPTAPPPAGGGAP